MVHESGFIFDIILRRTLSPLYTNPIFNKLSGKSYNLLSTQQLPIEHNNLLMEKDIPDYLVPDTADFVSSFKSKRIRQYQGFACDLKGFKDVADYLKHNIGKSSLKNIKARKRQLESRFNTAYKFYYGEIDKDHYDFLFDRFYQMLKSRFDEKKTYNRYLLDWKQYHELIYPMILKKEASLFVIYANDEPISISLEFYLYDICFGYIHGYDSTYQRYQLGDIRMVKLLEWLIDHNFKMFDSMMGETMFKAKWSNYTYDYYSELFFKENSIFARVKLGFLNAKLRLKQLLRNKGILGKWFSMDRFLYKRMVKKLKNFDWKKAQVY